MIPVYEIEVSIVWYNSCPSFQAQGDDYYSIEIESIEMLNHAFNMDYYK